VSGSVDILAPFILPVEQIHRAMQMALRARDDRIRIAKQLHDAERKELEAVNAYRALVIGTGQP
jgi:hypothetical protein